MEGQRSRKYLWIVVAVIIVVAVFAFIFGPQLAASYYNNLGASAFKSGDLAGAKNLFNRSLKFTASNSIAYFYLGKIALGKIDSGEGAKAFYPDANYQDAVSNFEKAFSAGLEKKDNAFYASALNDSGFSLWVLNEKDKADEKFLRHIEVAPGNAFASRYFLASDYYNRLNKPEDAEKILDPAPNAVKFDFQRINLFRVFALLVSIHAFLGDDKGVEAFATSAIATAGADSKGPDIQIVHVVLAQIYAKNGKLDLAKKEIQAANDLYGNPKQYDCFLALAYSLTKQYSLAIQVALSQPKPLQPSCLNALAKSYIAKGDSANAKKYLQDYINYADSMSDKNASFIRSVETAKEELKSLR